MKKSGNSITDKKGLVSMLAVYTNKKTGKPHYYFDNYSVSYANNFKYIDQTPITSDSAKAFVKLLGADISKFKDLDDSEQAVDFKIDKLNILKEQNIISFKDFISD